MFDADLFIKTLLYDMHPDITKYIPAYQSYIESVLESEAEEKQNNKNNSNWHRLWIVLDEVENAEQ